MNKINIIFIGIIEEKGYEKTIEVVAQVLENFNYKLLYSNKIGNILCLGKGINLLFILNMDPKEIDLYESLGIEFHILIHNFINKENYKKGLLKNQLRECEYYILNSDDENLTQLPLGDLKGVAVTYGFNNKATLTISSYNINQFIKANFCLQRAITSIFGEKMEPFEFVIEILSKNIDDIYPVLAASILSLILYNKDDAIETFKRIIV